MHNKLQIKLKSIHSKDPLLLVLLFQQAIFSQAPWAG